MDTDDDNPFLTNERIDSPETVTVSNHESIFDNDDIFESTSMEPAVDDLFDVVPRQPRDSTGTKRRQESEKRIPPAKKAKTIVTPKSGKTQQSKLTSYGVTESHSEASKIAGKSKISVSSDFGSLGCDKPIPIATKGKRKNPDENSNTEEAPRNLQQKKQEVKRQKEEAQQTPFYDDDDNCYPLVITTSSVNLIKRILETIAALVTEAIIQFNNDGISIFGMDQGQVAIVSATLERKNFLRFHCECQFDFGIETSHFKEIIQSVSRFDSLTFIIQDAKKCHDLDLLMSKRDKDVHVVTRLVGKEVEIEEFFIPDKKYGSIMTFDASDFQGYITDLHKVATVVIFATNFKEFRMISADVNPALSMPSPRNFLLYPSETGMQFENQKTDTEDVVFVPVDHDEIPKTKPRRRKLREVVEKTTEENLPDSFEQSKLMLKYVSTATKATPLAKKVKVFFRKGDPLVLTFPTLLGPLTYCIADVNEQQLPQ